MALLKGESRERPVQNPNAIHVDRIFNESQARERWEIISACTTADHIGLLKRPIAIEARNG